MQKDMNLKEIEEYLGIIDLEWGEFAAEENYKIENIIKEYEKEVR